MIRDILLQVLADHLNISGQICRCTGYVKIFDAVAQSVEAMGDAEANQ